MIEWLEPRQPLASWARAALVSVPPQGHVSPVGTPLWLPIDDRRSALVDGVTGGWVLCTNDVRGRIDDGWDRVVDPSLDQTFELLWRRGLVRIGGIGVFDGIDVANAIEASRERYTLVLLLSTGCTLACSYCYLGHRLPTDDVAMPVETALSAVDAALAKPWPEVVAHFGEVAVSWTLRVHRP